MAKQRLHKILAAAGIDSRRRCEELILQGLVSVNGRVVDTLPAFADPDEDVIAVSGEKIRPQRKVYFLLNKPKAVICTNYDPQGRTKAIDLVPSRQRIFCVGRLDADTAGLIILTNDSELTNKLTHPRFSVPKTYIASIEGGVDVHTAEKLRKGVWLAEGRTAPASVKILHHGPRESLLEITVRQSLNRQVRRMLTNIGLPVKSLKRTQIGKIDARGLGIGKFRPLTPAEVAYLKKITAL
jgi:pseudouridine synthase